MASPQGSIRLRTWGSRTCWIFPLAFLLLVTPAYAILQEKTPPIRAAHAMASTQHPLATESALAILKEGGNAIDAAVGAALVLAVVEPYNSGLGGGGFLLAYAPLKSAGDVGLPEAKKEFWFLDFRERAPILSHLSAYRREGRWDPKKSLQGWLAPAVPGAVAGLLAAHERAGALPFEKVMAPALRFAQEGMPVDRELRRRLDKRSSELRADAAASEVFFPKGKPPAVGERLVQKDLARSLKAIQKKGKAGFYAGWVAERFVKASQRAGGFISQTDLDHYQVYHLEPLRGSYRDYEIISAPPPSSGGGVLIETLGILEAFPPRQLAAQSAGSVHLMSEALRFSFRDRAKFYGDPRFVNVPLNELLDRKLALKRARLIRKSRRLPSESLAADHPIKDAQPGTQSHTTHLVVVDQNGAIASLTQSLNSSFGAGVMIPDTGILLNNTMDDFALSAGEPNDFGLVGGEANALAPGKTPLSSMTPTIVTKRGTPILVLGSPGGPRIITSVLNTIIQFIDGGRDIQAAVRAPRLHHQYVPDELFLEQDGFSSATVSALRKLNHHVSFESPWGNVQAIALGDASKGAPKTLEGASDPRGIGQTAGY